MKKFKKVLFPFVLVALTVLLGAWVYQSTSPDIKVESGGLSINQLSFAFPWTVARFNETLGKADRIDPGYNDIHTFDNLGIILYQPDELTISDFNIYYADDPDENMEFLPKAYFTGSLMVEKFKITGKTPFKKLNKALPQYNFKMSLIDAYRGEYENLYIYVKYDKAEKKILWISIGKKGNE